MKTKPIISLAVGIILTLSSLFIIPTCLVTYAQNAENSQTEEALPSEYCMRDDYIIYAQNQDSHGYCWNFAATMAVSTTIMKATGEYYDFSELWNGVALYNCDDQYRKVGAGGHITNHYEALKEAGLVLEADFPYQQSFTVSNQNAADYYNFYEKYSNDDLASCIVYDADTMFAIGDVEAIKSHIYNTGSVYMAFSFRTGFIEDGGKYYLEPNQKNTNSSHAVSIIGWDDNYQREFYLDGSTTPTVFKGAWIILNSYTEKSGNDGISFIFYDDKNISSIAGYKYETNTDKELYFYDKIESGYSYPTNLKGKYYGDLTAETTLTKQKNIFYDDVNLEYSYVISNGAKIESIDIYLGNKNVTDDFNVRVGREGNRFYISKKDAPYGQYKLLVTYGNGKKSDTYLNNFFVTHGLVGEEIEYDYDNNRFTINPGRDLEMYSFISSEKNYVIYTNSLKGQITFLPTEQSVYSDKNMSMPTISYKITNGDSCTSTHTIKSNSGYELEYNFTFEYYDDSSLQPVNVYYDLGGGVNHSRNYSQELASSTKSLKLYAPTRPGYTFAGWYLDYGNGSKKLTEANGVYYIDWDDIHHMGESPDLRALSHYQKYYNNSNTVFVYAHWEEIDYYNVDLTIVGEGTSQIKKDILVGTEDSVRYLFNPDSGHSLSRLEINGIAVGIDELAEIIKYGLLIKDIDRDLSITATFSEGVFLSLNYGENIKTAYLIGTSNGKEQKFYNGDFIPAEYFKSRDDIFNPSRPGAKTTVTYSVDDALDFDEDLPVLPAPIFGTEFILIVELFDDKPGYVNILDDSSSYSLVERGIFRKTVLFRASDEIAEINVGSAKARSIEKVEVSYSVGANISDHYISADINAMRGDKNTAVFDAGQIVYLFVKKQANSPVYRYILPDGFEAVGNGWYRKAVYVNPDNTNIGTIKATKTIAGNYTVTWKNWDGTVIYSQPCRFGSIPVFNDKNSEPGTNPTRPDDGIYTYTFIGWDKRLDAVEDDVTFTAVFNATLMQHSVVVEPTENGSISTNAGSSINYFDSFTYTFTPDTGYRVKDVIINGESVGALTSYTFSEVRSDQTLRVEFEKITYSVQVICGENGDATTHGVQQIEHGSGITVKITPAEFFVVDFIKIDGKTVETTDSLTVSNITKDTVIEIAFKKATLTITTESRGKGSATPSMTASGGDNVRVDFSADFGHKIKDVIIDGVSIGPVDCYVFDKVASDHTVCVEYKVDALLTILLSAPVVLLIGAAVSLPILIKKRKANSITVENEITDDTDPVNRENM